jgi:hypothetical protein
MLTYFCPKCWKMIKESEQTCLNCGYVLEEFQKTLYEDKLLAALHHPVPEHRIMAAQILGNRQSHQALPEFLKIVVSGETDYFFLRAVLLAAAKIDHPNRYIILQKACLNPSKLVSDLAKELLAQVTKNRQASED